MHFNREITFLLIVITSKNINYPYEHDNLLTYYIDRKRNEVFHGIKAKHIVFSMLFDFIGMFSYPILMESESISETSENKMRIYCFRY